MTVQDKLTFEAFPLGVGRAWYVLVTWPNGKIEKVMGFATGELASKFINGPESGRWLAQRRIADRLLDGETADTHADVGKARLVAL